MLESQFQAKLIRKIEDLFPGCYIFKQDANQRQGIPDLLILHNDRWAMLEVKASARAKHQPNQDYYVQKFGAMSYAAFVFPENLEATLYALQRALEPRGNTRLAER
jgi:hypothetical protein